MRTRGCARSEITADYSKLNFVELVEGDNALFNTAEYMGVGDLLGMYAWDGLHHSQMGGMKTD